MDNTRHSAVVDRERSIKIKYVREPKNLVISWFAGLPGM